MISWLNRRLADGQSPLHSATTPAPTTVPTSIQLTLPRTNKFFPNRFETRTPAPSSTQGNVPYSGMHFRNPIVQNPNINQTMRTSARSTGVGVADSTAGLNFNKTGQISSTSTPLERLNGFNKSPNSGGTSNVPPIIENNNAPPTMNGKVKSTTNLQGGLRRAVLDKPLLPSAYFPKTLH